MKTVFSLAFGLCLMIPFGAFAEDADPARIVFLGDSITQGGDRKPNGYVKLIRRELVEDDSAEVEVIGAGISGNKVPDLEKRLDRDVISKKPTLTVIYIGINDVWHSQSGRGTSKEDYRAGLNRIIEKLHENDSHVLLCTPTVIGEKPDGTNSLDEMLEEYAEISREVAAANGVPLLDLRKAFIDELKKSNADGKERGILTGDGVHLNEAGDKFVAKLMLEPINYFLAVNKPGADPANWPSAGAYTTLPEDEPNRDGQILRHVVLFQFKEGTDDKTVSLIEREFAALENKIDVVIDFEFGTDVGVEGLSDGFTHCFVVTFADAKDRDAYLPHPAHQAFVKILRPHLEKVLVVDYYTPKE